MRMAVADHISDTFLDTLVPLMLLVEAAQEGNQKEVEECAIVFTESAAKLEEVRFLLLPFLHCTSYVHTELFIMNYVLEVQESMLLFFFGLR